MVPRARQRSLETDVAISSLPKCGFLFRPHNRFFPHFTASSQFSLSRRH
jgi:hypothetical protein